MRSHATVPYAERVEDDLFKIYFSARDEQNRSRTFSLLWDAKHPHEPPQLMGQLFHLFDSPNRFGLDPFYTLHVWAWKDSPTGTFVNWNANVSCDAFAGQ